VRGGGEQGRSVSLHRFGDVDNDGDAYIFTAPFICHTDPEREPLPGTARLTGSWARQRSAVARSPASGIMSL
jgi:hypothetical protein